MKLDPDEKVIFKSSSSFGVSVGFPLSKGGKYGTSGNYSGATLYLTDKRICAEILLAKILDVPVSDILYFRIEKKLFNFTFMRIVYKENGEVMISANKEDWNKLIEGLEKLKIKRVTDIRYSQTQKTVIQKENIVSYIWIAIGIVFAIIALFIGPITNFLFRK